MEPKIVAAAIPVVNVATRAKRIILRANGLSPLNLTHQREGQRLGLAQVQALGVAYEGIEFALGSRYRAESLPTGFLIRGETEEDRAHSTAARPLCSRDQEPCGRRIPRLLARKA